MHNHLKTTMRDLEFEHGHQVTITTTGARSVAVRWKPGASLADKTRLDRDLSQLLGIKGRRWDRSIEEKPKKRKRRKGEPPRRLGSYSPKGAA